MKRFVMFFGMAVLSLFVFTSSALAGGGDITMTSLNLTALADPVSYQNLQGIIFNSYGKALAFGIVVLVAFAAIWKLYRIVRGA